MTNFGDIIEYEFKKYVYLATIDDIVYLAKIIAGEIAQEIIKERERLENSAIKGFLPAQQKLDKISFCFVVLTSERFEGSIAYCRPPVINSDEFDYTANYAQLNKKDLAAIKDEIINGNYPGGLKKFVQTIEIRE